MCVLYLSFARSLASFWSLYLSLSPCLSFFYSLSVCLSHPHPPPPRVDVRLQGLHRTIPQYHLVQCLSPVVAGPWQCPSRTTRLRTASWPWQRASSGCPWTRACWSSPSWSGDWGECRTAWAGPNLDNTDICPSRSGHVM